MDRLLRFLMVFMFVWCSVLGILSTEALAQKKRIGVLLWSDEQRYLDGMNAMIEQLKKEGFSDENLEIKIESGGGNKAKTMKIAQNFAAEKMDVYVAFGTNALTALVKETKDKPIVFSIVYDPVAVGIADSLQSSGNNTTGNTTFIAMSEIINRLKMIVPLKNLAVLYTPNQKNSEAQLKDLQKIQNKCSINILPVPLNTKEDAFSILPYIKGKAEAIYFTGSGFVGEATPAIVATAIKERIVTVSHLADYVDQGVLFGVGADMREEGQGAAKKVVAIIKGTKPSDIPIDGPQKIDIFINMKTANAIGVAIPDDLKKEATKIIE